jgi:pyrimidine-specific ribonucleoside hydrolase
MKKIKRVIWYNETLDPFTGTNYERDPEAADVVLSKNLNISVISNLSKTGAAFSKKLFQNIKSIETPFARTIVISHSYPPVLERINNGHMILWDDLLPVFFICPDCFDMEPDKTNPNISMTKDYDILEIRRRILDILSQQYDYSRHIMFDKFPVDPDIYRSDITPVAREIIEKFGSDEWRICVLTNEIHGHLGIYSIVGAKMGLKAREYFSVGVDQLQVISYAGNRPPLSCLNDGLQISTGATLGQGTITVSSDSVLLPKAHFTFEGKTIEMQLKDEYREQVESDISQGIVQFGNLTSGYWKLIRKLGLKYWKEWDRNEMFTVTLVE